MNWFIDRSRFQKLLIRHENKKNFAYVDCCGRPWKLCVCVEKGNLSIGIGRNLDEKGITDPEAMFLSQNDIETAIYETRKAFPWVDQLSEPRKEVICSMVFNMGITRVKGFERTLAALKAGDFELTATEMLRSRWAQQVGYRAEELATMMREDRFIV